MFNINTKKNMINNMIMNQNMNKFENMILNLPEYIGKEILKFLIPDENSVSFRDEDEDLDQDQDEHKKPNKKNVVFVYDKKLLNDNKFLFFKYDVNEKKKYYICKKVSDYHCCMCDWKQTCICNYKKNNFCYYYYTKYVGNNLNNAMFELLIDKITTKVVTDDHEILLEEKYNLFNYSVSDDESEYESESEINFDYVIRLRGPGGRL